MYYFHLFFFVLLKWAPLQGHKLNKSARALKLHSVISLIPFLSDFSIIDRYFNGRFWSNALNMHIFLISGFRSVRFDHTFSRSHVSILVLTFFSNRHLTGSWWRKMMKYNPKSRNTSIAYFSHTKFREKRIKCEAATVPASF